MSEPIMMSKKEREYAYCLRQVRASTLTVSEASEQLGITERHVFRLLTRFGEAGEAGLVHRLRHRPSNHGYARTVRQEVVDLYRTRYVDYGPTLFSEKIQELRGWSISPETLRRWLLKEGLWNCARNRGRHRKRRLRREAMGALVQIDGSHHDWFEGRGPVCCLFVFIDDASNCTYLHFAPSENTLDALKALRGYVTRYGRFQQAYTDRKSVFHALQGPPPPFALAVSALGGEMITAHSPQAKGRVERANRTHQDRLVKALREHQISSVEEANRFLADGYLDQHNARFAHPEGVPDLHRPIEGLDLDNLISITHTRCVRHDMTFQFKGKWYQICHDRGLLPLPRQYIDVRVWLDGSLHAFWKERPLKFHLCETRPQHPRVIPFPSEKHPWRHTPPIGKAKYLSMEQLCKK